MTTAPCRRRNGDAVLRVENFGDLITADHIFINEGCESRNNHPYAVVVQDFATQWSPSNQCKTKNFSGDGEAFTEVSRAIGKAESHLH